jgi:hypothetical protein
LGERLPEIAMPLYLLSLPETATFSVCELSAEDATEVRARLAAAGAFSAERRDEQGEPRERAAFEPLEPDDRATVEALIDLWEAARR